MCKECFYYNDHVGVCHVIPEFLCKVSESYICKEFINHYATEGQADDNMDENSIKMILSVS